MASPVTRPSRLMSNTATGCWPGMALPAHRSVILAFTLLRYHANGKSPTFSVNAPAPCGEPSARPSGAGGGAARATVSGATRSGIAFGVLGPVIVGSSLSPARGVADGRGMLARSGSDGSSRARGGISGAAALRGGVSRCGSSAGRGGSGRATSSGRGGSVGAGVVCPWGEPTAATAGTRLTTYVFGCDCDHARAPSTTATARTTCTIPETTIAVTGSGTFPRAGPRAGRIRIVAAAMLTSALADGLGHHAEALDAGAPDHVHSLDHRTIRQAGVGLQIEGFVVAAAERVTQHPVEAPGRHAFVVQIERAVLRHCQHHALLDGGGLGSRARQVHVDAAVHHRRRQHEDQQQHEHHVDERDDVDLGETRADPAPTVGRAGAKCHLSRASRASASAG